MLRPLWPGLYQKENHTFVSIQLDGRRYIVQSLLGSKDANLPRVKLIGSTRGCKAIVTDSLRC